MDKQCPKLAVIPNHAEFIIEIAVLEQFRQFSLETQFKQKEHTGVLLAHKNKEAQLVLSALTKDSGDKDKAIREADYVSEDTLFRCSEEKVELADLFYCGEWHSHLLSTKFSPDDLLWFFQTGQFQVYQILVTLQGWRYVYRHFRWGTNIESPLLPYKGAHIISREC